VTSPISNEDLMRYLDDELSPEERLRVEAAIQDSTELRRDLAIYSSMRTDLSELPGGRRPDRSVWAAVNRQLTRPVGWVLLVGGFVLWAGYGAWVFGTSPANPVEKLAVGALVVGFLILLLAAIFERLGEWRNDPYRDVER
jgi:anti-sigma factor RsiW